MRHDAPSAPDPEPVVVPGPDGVPARGAAAFLATLEVYEGCPPEQLDECGPGGPPNRP